MALGLATAAILLLAWPILQAISLIRSLPWGGERELAPIALAGTVLFLFAAVAPGVFTALDRTSIEALVELRNLRQSSQHWELSGLLRPFDALRAAPFLLGATNLSAEIWIADLLLVLISTSVFVAAARLGGVFAGVAAALLLSADSSMIEALRSFDPALVHVAGLAIVFASIVAVGGAPWPRLTSVSALALLGFIALSAGTSGATSSYISILKGKALILPCASIAILGGGALRWWSKGLRAQSIDWRGYRICIFALLCVALIAAVCAFLFRLTVPVYLMLQLIAAVIAGGVIGGFLRLLRWHPLAAPAIIIAASIFRVVVIPYEAKRIGGFASTMDDLKAVVPTNARLGSAIDPDLAAEFLRRPVSSLKSILEQPLNTSEAPLILETRFSSIRDLHRIRDRFRLVPILPGISWAYNLGEAQAAPAASQ